MYFCLVAIAFIPLSSSVIAFLMMGCCASVAVDIALNISFLVAFTCSSTAALKENCALFPFFWNWNGRLSSFLAISCEASSCVVDTFHFSCSIEDENFLLSASMALNTRCISSAITKVVLYVAHLSNTWRRVSHHLPNPLIY